MKQNKVIVLIVIVVAIYYIHCNKKQSSFGETADSVNVELINKTGSTVGVVYNTKDATTKEITSKTTIVNNGSSYKFTFTKGVNTIQFVPMMGGSFASDTIGYSSNWVAGSSLKFDILVNTKTLRWANSTDNVPIPATTGPECPVPECPKSGGFCSIM